MLTNLVRKAQNTAARTARKTAFGAGALACLGVGLGFLTAAAWMFLLTQTTPMNAALILGGVYSGVGFVLLAIMGSIGKSDSEEKPTESAAMVEADIAKIITAFMTGLSAGRRTRS